MLSHPVIAAVHTEEDFKASLTAPVSLIFQLAPNIFTLPRQVKTAHEAGKKLFVHLDLAEGIARDRYGIRFLFKLGVDGVLSTRAQLLKLAREEGLFTVQRFFALDSRSVQTIVDAVKTTRVDMIEVMPGVVPKVIHRLSSLVDIPIIAGGLIETTAERDAILNCGGRAVSTGNRSLWEEVW